MVFPLLKIPSNFTLTHQTSGFPSMLSLHTKTEETMEKLITYWGTRQDAILDGLFKKWKQVNVSDWISNQELFHLRGFIPRRKYNKYTNKRGFAKQKREDLLKIIPPVKNVDIMLRKKFTSDSIELSELHTHGKE